MGENDVQIAFFLLNDRGNHHHLLFVGDIGNDGVGIRASLCDCLIKNVLAAARDIDKSTFFSKVLCARQTEPGSATSNQRYLTF